MSQTSHKTFNGVLLINKDKDCTSHQIVKDIRQILKQKSVGHAGTLDPMARGLLVILCGMATKLSLYFINSDKHYKLSMKFGLETTTFDLKGETVRSEEASLKKEDLKKLLQEGACDMDLPVPLFSAVKVKGRKLYSYAFSGQGEKVTPPIKNMRFWGLKIHELKKNGATLNISCSKGSYLRSWVQHLGQKTGKGACLTKLERIASGNFHVNKSLTTEELKHKLSDNFPEDEDHLKSLLGDSFLRPNEALTDFSTVELTNQNAKILNQGKLSLYILQTLQNNQIAVNKKGISQILKAVQGQKLIALLEISPFKKIKILRNFPYQNS